MTYTHRFLTPRPAKLKGESVQGDKILTSPTFRRPCAGLTATLLAVFLAACETPRTSSSEFFRDVWSAQPGAEGAPSIEEGSAEPLEPYAASGGGGIRPFEVRGSGRLAQLPGPRPRGIQLAQVQDTAEGVTMNFVDADLREVIRAVTVSPSPSSTTASPRRSSASPSACSATVRWPRRSPRRS